MEFVTYQVVTSRAVEKVDDNKMIKTAIIKTIAFFDLFDYPLTADEIRKYLWLPSGGIVTGTEIITELAALESIVETIDGFYYLSGRQEIVGQRQASRGWAGEKLKIAYSATRWLKYLSGIKLVAVVNSVVLGSVKKDSDIDLFIVVARGRMWLTRLAVTLLVQFLGVRRHGRHVSNRLCLSFYVTEDKLDLAAVRNQTDPYFYYWLATLQLIYDDGCYEKLIKENLWVHDCLPNFSEVAVNPKFHTNDNWSSNLIKTLNGWWFYSFIGAAAELLAGKIQRKKMAGNLSSLASEPDSRVIISDTMLKFHESDRREEFRRRWEDNYKLILAKL